MFRVTGDAAAAARRVTSIKNTMKNLLGNQGFRNSMGNVGDEIVEALDPRVLRKQIDGVGGSSETLAKKMGDILPQNKLDEMAGRIDPSTGKNLKNKLWDELDPSEQTALATKFRKQADIAADAGSGAARRADETADGARRSAQKMDEMDPDDAAKALKKTKGARKSKLQKFCGKSGAICVVGGLIGVGAGAYGCWLGAEHAEKKKLEKQCVAWCVPKKWGEIRADTDGTQPPPDTTPKSAYAEEGDERWCGLANNTKVSPGPPQPAGVPVGAPTSIIDFLSQLKWLRQLLPRPRLMFVQIHLQPILGL